MVRELSERVAERFAAADAEHLLRDRDLAGDAERMRQVAAQWMMAPFLSGVGRLRYFPASSQVLQNRVGYRELLRHYLAIILAARDPIHARDLQLIMEAKSASLLYEYWTFFTLADALRPLLGYPVQATQMTSDATASARVHSICGRRAALPRGTLAFRPDNLAAWLDAPPFEPM